MYKLTRQEASELLNMSTRSIDRYIKSGKIRSKKDGKIVYVNQNDIDNLKNGGGQNQEIIVPEKKSSFSKEKQETSEDEVAKVVHKNSGNSLAVLEPIYEDLKNEINKKDIIIQDLSIRLGRAEEIAKNSVSISEFKKSQFLLEESKGFLSKEVEELRNTKVKLSKDLKYEKSTNNILVFFILVLLTIAIVIWFTKV
nr:helix-turn-helix domain-containing protein [Candidatus Gracilibacteria bacterium]